MDHRQTKPTGIRVLVAVVLLALGGEAVPAAPGDLLAAGAVAQEVILGENQIEIRGTALPLPDIHWNADRNIFTLVLEPVVLNSELSPQGEASGILRSANVIVPDVEEGPAATLTVIAELTVTARQTVYYSEDGSSVRIVFEPIEAADSEAGVASELTDGFETIELRYADADALANTLRRLASGGDRSIQVDSRLNMLILDRQMDRFGELWELIRLLDQPGDQILIDAQIVELRSDAASQLGLDLPSSITMSIGEDAGYAQAVPFPFQLFLRSPIEISATLDMLTGEGRADILANPRVATIDGVPAVVQTQERFPIIVTQTSGNQNYQTKQDIVGGISLSITPRHNGDGEITTVIETDVTTITGTTKEGYPTTSSRQISTTVRVQSGQAIVIGGLRERRDIVHDDSLPLLGKIPILGLLFTNRRAKTAETDLYVIVTPYLIGGGR